MKCPSCSHHILETTARFCSWCGLKLSDPPANTENTNQPLSLVSDSEATAEKSETLDSQESNSSPKQLNDEDITNPKKRKKQRKRNKKKKDCSSSSDREQSQTDLSYVSLGKSGDQKKAGRESSGSETPGSVLDDSSDSHQDQLSCIDNQPTSLTTNTSALPSEDTQGRTAATSEAKGSEESPGAPDEGKIASKSTQDQTLQTELVYCPIHLPISSDGKSTISQSGSSEWPKATNRNTTTVATKQHPLAQNDDAVPNVKQMEQTKQKGNDQQFQKKKQVPATQQKMDLSCETLAKADSTGSSVEPQGVAEMEVLQEQNSNDEETASATQPVLDQSPNEEPNVKQTEQTKQKGKNQQVQKKKQIPATEQKMDLGPLTPSKFDSTETSVDPDPEETLEPVVVQESGSKRVFTAGHTSDTERGGKDEKDSSPPTVLPAKRLTRNKTIAACDRLTIYFHAVLSKDFKYDLKEDRIFIRAGPPFGSWEEDAAELSVTRDLGEHGFLIEGSLTTTKSEAESVSIPYKYLLYHSKKKDKYEYEFIYKLDSQQTTNRCLFVKPSLLTDNGDWHQYDDIICAEPSKSMLKRLKDTIKDVVWPEQRNDLIQGREIAGSVMLETIFDLLRSWTAVNLRNFQIQLNQFYHVYGEPYVYEESQKKWYSLNYGEDDVRRLLKEFMLTKVIPQLLRDGEGEMLYIEDPLKAAVIMLYVWRQHRVKLDNGELHRLCTVLCLPKLDKDNFLQYWTQFCHDVDDLKNLPVRLVFLVNAVKRAGMPHWILVLPLLHLLKGTTKPFEAPTSGKQKYGASWAGLQDIEMDGMSSQDKRALVNLMKSHSYLMEVDPRLVRSCLYVMSFDELMECVIDINTELLDMLHIFTNKVSQDITNSNFQTVTDIISHIQQHLIEVKYSRFNEAYRRACLETAVKMLEKICKGVKPASYSQNHPDIPVACMNLVALVSDFVYCDGQQETQKEGRCQQYVKELIAQALTIMRDWISCSFRKPLLTSGLTSLYQVEATAEIQMWNNIISIHFKDDDCTKQWRVTFAMDFEGKYKKESTLDQIELYYTKIEELRESHPYVAAIIEKCALDAVTSLCHSKSEGKLFEKFKINWKFGKLISAIIEKSWPRNHRGNYEEDEEIVLQHLLTWSASKNVFQLHGTEEMLIQTLTQDASYRIAVAVSAFIAIKNQLVCGNIKISLLKIILEKRDAFLELMKIDCLCEDEQYKDTVKMRRLLQCRQDEVASVYHEKELVDLLLTMSQTLGEHISVDLVDLEERQQVNIEVMPLSHFMEAHQFNLMPSDMTGVVTYFNLNQEVRKMAEVLYTFRDSHIFKVCWEDQAKSMAAEELKVESAHQKEVAGMATLIIIYADIFKPCFAHYKNIYTCLKNGSITLEEVNQQFGDYKGKYEELSQDLAIMCRVDQSSDKQWIHSRVQQIEQYHELHLAVASAKIIMMVKETLCLQGDFKVMETLTEVSQDDFQKEQLNRIDSDLMQAKKILVDITEPRRLCLQELGLRGHFVKWVKDALEDINELKVFVDLASISAGENDMDVDRVACFHDSVLGYSSMLYELKPHAGFQEMKEVLKKLWRALENDSNLPKKLRDSARHLEWLKTVKDSHGSVELSSLSLASSINTRGIYQISVQSAQKLSLDTILKLQIPEEHDEGQRMRCYSLEDLRELQNKLMLMSGKGDQGQNEVDHFAEIFAGVQRLAEAFIALYTAGNPLFRHWEAEINCCLSSETSIAMDFHLGSVLGVVKVEGNVEEQLPELCRKMEKCLNYWIDFVDKQRSQHYYLNYFTAEQIVYLCTKLTQTNMVNVDDQVLMMLSFVSTNCTASDLREVRHALQYEILTKAEVRNEDIDFQTFFVPRSEQGDSEFISSLDPLPSLMESNVLQKFDVIWNSYMKDMRNSLPDILDIKSLGRLLEMLANRDHGGKEDKNKEGMSDVTMGNVINRQLPRGLATGNPNLIVCPHEEVLMSCIAIYMNSEAETLPTYDEVLLCNSSTPYEQVELFLRRCLSTGYRGQKIYSLLYGDLLTYDVSSKVENFFKRMKLQSRKDYKLVIICSSEREHAYIPSAFSQYRLPMIPQKSMIRIQQYLHKHFTVPADRCSAAAVFKDRLGVGVISSKRAGVGKSLYIKRLYEKLKDTESVLSVMKCVRLIEPNVNEDVILQSLLKTCKRKELMMFHFDVTSSVQKGLHEFLFKLLILRYLMDSEGKMWKCSDKHLYLIEILEQTVKPTKNPSWQDQTVTTFVNAFPNIFCRPPREVLILEMRRQDNPIVLITDDPMMDDQKFRSAAFQRPYQYLTRFHNHIGLDKFKYRDVEGSHVECLQILLRYCGIIDPSWAELRNFAWFLNLQLKDSETSVFCDATFTGDTLTGFKTFVVDFMILMAKDFATPSLNISDQSPGRLTIDQTVDKDKELAPFLIRKRWETEPHPYIFFNDDHVSMTFIGFHLQPNQQKFVDAIEPTSGKVIKKNVMTRALYEGLKLQRVPFNTDFERLPRSEKIDRICRVLGVQWPLDPDETYELTTDNILKMLAIHMRFRCGIPVIIMGETGCGKTRLIKFLCQLRRSGVATENMKLVKVHGGTTSEMIYTKVEEAENIAFINKQKYGFDSILFFDEANTTEAISSIKEILCDKTVNGAPLMANSGLQIIAACNPYRKHTDEMIQRLESAGLGYRVRAEETDEKLGSIPLRQLVYRVQALPPSMIPLVWDFGQLNDHTERIYIQQIVQRVVENKAVGKSYIKCITDVLSASQRYMRKRKDECSFVSLRDVERCMQCFVWFFDNHVKLFAKLDEFESKQKAKNNERHQRQLDIRDPVLWSLIIAIGVCYHACLENKDEYRKRVGRSLPPTYNPAKLLHEISLMQDLLLSGVPMGDTIARNGALKENVFMMVVCIELRIPLFLVGKPGSSKSLSKTLVADAMQGQAAHSDLYKMLKQVHLVSFQCSPHSTPDGIINTFKQCGRFQEGKNLDEYISVVVLDEIGLAEDSPKMPLKTLHPLLEEGCIDDEPLPHKKVGFIGISNWALDPAKMNRGIFVSRGDPDEKELIESAKGICRSDAMALEKVRDFFMPFARAYLHICHKQGKGFFGLRDYYSLIKMIFAVAKANQQKPTADETAKAVLRNFSGKDDVDAVAVFTKRLQIVPNLDNINAIEFVRENIQAVGQEEECRYLLLLTKNYAALQILQQTFFTESEQPEIIFGSSFPKDQEYTQICRNINRVKICMETGQTVVLLNLQNLYESLYDALNQYYVCLGGHKYVDLGLGTHRVKCRVHKDFRLIVIEEREVVYKQFPVPLINRLEKHYLDIHTVLKTEQKRMVAELEKWVTLFVSFGSQNTAASQTYKYKPPDVFIGYHSDTCASVMVQVIEKLKDSLDISDSERRVLDEAKLTLLKCATPDSVVRLECTGLPKVESEFLARVYFEEQNSSCLADFILAHTWEEVQCHSFTEVTTFSRLLTASDLDSLEPLLDSVELLSLQQFDTEHSFLKKIRSFLTAGNGNARPCNKILIIQCDFDEAARSANLIASAKYSSINEINKIIQQSPGSKVFVYFVTRLPRMEGGTSYVGFHGGPWKSAHIDDLRRSKDIVSDINALKNMTISQMFEPKRSRTKDMEVENMYTENEQEEAELKDCDQAVDTTALLRSCVQSAAGMLRDQVDSGLRSTRRLEILVTLLSDDDKIKGEFLQTLKRHIHLLLATRDKTISSIKSNWVIKEASNFDALQEGGTFRHTLWKHTQAVVIPILSQLVSVIDCDQNLDILLDKNCGESVKRLWLDIFGNEKLLEIKRLQLDHTSERTILVQNYIAQDRNMSCSMPFSWRIKNYLEELWVHALQNEGHTQSEFQEFFWKTPLGQYIAKADPEMQTEFFHRYLQDFIYMTMNVTCQEDLQLLCSALNCCVNELRLQHNAMDSVASLPWVHAAYHEFKNRLQNLSRMICIEPGVIQHLLKNHHSRDGVELVLDVYAAFACVEYLEPRTLITDAQRQAWLRQVKTLQVPIELIFSEESVKHYGERSKAIVCRVQAGWNRIFSLSLFVEHMLLGIEEVEKKLAPLVLEHTKCLGQILDKNSDLKTYQAFEEVIALLKTCKDGAIERIFRFGLPLCPVCMGDPQDPLCLPCDHIYCVACIKQWLCPGQMYCPLCMMQVNSNFPMVPSDALRVQVSKHAWFRRQSNAFFIDLVSTLCFKDNSPPCSDIILHLLSFLMVEAKGVPILGGNRKMLTKVLSPFDDSVDKNPVVRSVVLKLLLKYSFHEVKDYLQQHLVAVEQSDILEKTNKTELYLLYINCLEDSMFERFQFRSIADQQVCLQDESEFLMDYLQSQSAEIITVEYLQQVARVRMDLDMAANFIVETIRDSEAQKSGHSGTAAFLASVLDLCSRSGNDWYRVYLIRKICCQHGVEFVMKLLKVHTVQWLFPEEVLQKSEEATPTDQYLVCGEHYKTVRNAVGKAVMEGRVDGLDRACEGCGASPQWTTVYLLLALYREVTTLYRDPSVSFQPKPEQVEALLDYSQNSKFLANPEVKAFAQALVTNQLGPLVLRPGTSGAKSSLVDLTVHVAAVLICGNQGILAPLQQLAMAPADMQNAFLPTMADDMFVVAQQALGPLQWYICPNGHPCTIGECGRPAERSHCFDCGVEIGGSNHRPVRGFQAVRLQGDHTLAGHILGNPRRRDNPDMLDTKSISPVPFTVVRMLTHMAMLLGAVNHQQSISAIIKPPVADPGAFLLAHMQKDLKHLIRSLGKGTDDTVSVAHLLINSLLEANQQQQWPASSDNLLSTKEGRNGWEMEVSNTIITPQLKHLDRSLKEVNTFIQNDSRISANPITKLLFGDPCLFLASLPPNSLIHCSAVWSCRERISLLSLTHIVEQSDGRDALPVLWRFLHKEAEIRLVKHLPNILILQSDLVKKFQNVSDLTLCTIDEFLHSQKTASLKVWYEKHIKIFLATWNQLRVSLATTGEIKIPAEFCQKDLDINSDFKVLLPRRQGPGLCSTALVSYLIALHNDMIYCVDQHSGEETSYKVSPADLTDLHVIRYELGRDLMPLVLSNTQYSIERGQETLYEFDLPKIQQQLISRFLLGKPLITLNGIPTLVNRHDRNYEIILKDVKAKVQQEALQTLTLLAVAAELHSYSEVCEALSTLEVALGFLAMTGGDPQMQLSGYLEEVLQMQNQVAPHIVKALSMCYLKHCVALWQLLASLKSENMLRLKRDPFVGVSEQYKQALTEDEHRLLTAFFSKNGADSFLLEMHEFLVLVLKKPNAPDTYRPDWGLKVTLVSYMERKDLDIPPDVEELFPEEILLCHYVEAWKFIIAFKQERRRQ